MSTAILTFSNQYDRSLIDYQFCSCAFVPDHGFRRDGWVTTMFFEHQSSGANRLSCSQGQTVVSKVGTAVASEHAET